MFETIRSRSLCRNAGCSSASFSSATYASAFSLVHRAADHRHLLVDVAVDRRRHRKQHFEDLLVAVMHRTGRRDHLGRHLGQALLSVRVRRRAGAEQQTEVDERRPRRQGEHLGFSGFLHHGGRGLRGHLRLGKRFVRQRGGGLGRLDEVLVGDPPDVLRRHLGVHPVDAVDRVRVASPRDVAGERARDAFRVVERRREAVPHAGLGPAQLGLVPQLGLQLLAGREDLLAHVGDFRRVLDPRTDRQQVRIGVVPEVVVEDVDHALADVELLVELRVRREGQRPQDVDDRHVRLGGRERRAFVCDQDPWTGR